LGWRLGLHYKEYLVAEELRAIVEGIRQAHCDVVIAVENGEVLLRDLGCARKIFYANAPAAPEIYSAARQANGNFDWDDYERRCRKEIEYYAAADVVIFCWNTHAEFVKQYIYSGTNVLPHPGLGWFGCEPQKKRSSYRYPPFIAYMGLTNASWNNSAMLAKLSGDLPYVIHCFGFQPPQDSLLNYQGFADSTDVLSRYQFGLHTATTDKGRRFGFASKVMTCLSYGLPVLSPKWQLLSQQLRGVISYEEATIESLIEHAAEPDNWAKLADAAYDQAQELSWNKVFKPLLPMLG
jgi:hypothetical protein